MMILYKRNPDIGTKQNVSVGGDVYGNAYKFQISLGFESKSQFPCRFKC